MRGAHQLRMLSHIIRCAVCGQSLPRAQSRGSAQNSASGKRITVSEPLTAHRSPLTSFRAALVIGFVATSMILVLSPSQAVQAATCGETATNLAKATFDAAKDGCGSSTDSAACGQCVDQASSPANAVYQACGSATPADCSACIAKADNSAKSAYTACQTGAAKPAAKPKAQPGSPTALPDPLSGLNFPKLIGNVIRAFSGIAGAIALLMFVYGGVMWILSGGSQEKVKAAQKILVNASIGLILIFGAYTFVSSIVNLIIAPPPGTVGGGEGGETAPTPLYGPPFLSFRPERSEGRNPFSSEYTV